MTPEWVAVDWGTSHLRAFLMQADTVIDRRDSDKGMGCLTQSEFEPALVGLIGDVIPETGALDVLCCGMVGSRQGWAEAPYQSVPCKVPGIAQSVAPVMTTKGLNVRILPGVKQAKPADVMRGEETQIAGVIAQNKNFDGVICLPGTHTKWAHISAEEIVSFRTFMTGELFALLSDQSVLRHSVAADSWDDDAFAKAVDQAMGRPASVAAELFSIRAEGLLNDLGADAARARLSGLLIGAEIAASKPYWLGQDVVVLGAKGIAAAYVKALELQGVPARSMDGDELVLRGLSAARTGW